MGIFTVTIKSLVKSRNSARSAKCLLIKYSLSLSLSGSFFNLLADFKYYYFVFFLAAQVTPSPQTVFRTSSFSLVGVTHVNLPIIKSKRFSLDKVTAKVPT